VATAEYNESQQRQNVHNGTRGGNYTTNSTNLHDTGYETERSTIGTNTSNTALVDDINDETAGSVQGDVNGERATNRETDGDSLRDVNVTTTTAYVKERSGQKTSATNHDSLWFGNRESISGSRRDS
jgi:hypothetical protein